MGFGISKGVALAALMGIGSLGIGSLAFAQDPEPQRNPPRPELPGAGEKQPPGQDGRDGKAGDRQERPERVPFTGGTYDAAPVDAQHQALLQDDWFYDTYTMDEGFASDFFQRSNLTGMYEGSEDENDWFFDSYEMLESRAQPPRGRQPSPRPGGGDRGNQGDQANPDDQRQDDGARGDRARGDKDRMGRDKPAKETLSLDGTVVGIKEVEVSIEQMGGEQAGEGAHQVILLANGEERYVVDLGPAESLADLELEIGNRVAVEGFLGRVGPRAILFANQLSPQGEDPVNIRQDLDLEVEPIPRTPARAREITGEILRMKEVDIEAGRQGAEKRGAEKQGQQAKSHTVALVETENMGTLLVDLGPTNAFNQFEIEEGDEITTNARIVPLGEYLVAWADQLDVDGEMVDLRGKQAQRGQGQGRGSGTR